MDFNQFKQQFAQLALLQADPNIYVAPQIPMNKILGAMSYLPAQTQAEEVLVLVDETVFGQGKNGLCLTDQGIYFKEAFASANAYPLKSISSVGYSMGLLSKHLVINGTVKVSLAQPEKAGIRLLADFLNQYCAFAKAQTQKNSSDFIHENQQQTQSQDTIANLQPIMKLYAYLLLGWRGEWSQSTRTLMTQLFDRDLVHPNDQQFLKQMMQQNHPFDFFDILDEITLIQHSLPPSLSLALLEEVLVLMNKRNFDAETTRSHFFQISTALNVEQQTAFAILTKYPAYTDTQAKQHAPQSSIPIHQLTPVQLAACELLDITPEQLDRPSLTLAYRRKMADFHPDQYQQLPPAVRQLIEQQAQQINQARSCLEALLASF
ncbi:J domain-containing protein [Acinetobacter haemolyticus]|uniref:J domain-containing protein n=1 Tax=Acinetobacter haemolyticus TaxID=29430 RepID=UPI003898F4FE